MCAHSRPFLTVDPFWVLALIMAGLAGIGLASHAMPRGQSASNGKSRRHLSQDTIEKGGGVLLMVIFSRAMMPMSSVAPWGHDAREQ